MSRSPRPAAAALLAAAFLAIPAAPAAALPAAALPAVPSAAPSPPAGPQTFGVQPAGPSKPDARNRFSYAVTPGARLVDHIAVRNYGTAPLRLAVYAADAMNTPDGGFDLLTANARSTGVGAWAVADVSAVVVPARGTAIVPFRLTVPANATPGDHVGGIVASLRTVRTAGNGKKVTVEDRVGARIYLRVAGQLRGALRVDDLQAGYDGTVNPVGRGRVRVSYVVRNVGNLRLSGHQTVRVTGWFGQSALATGLPEVPELLPGGSMQVSVVVPRVFPMVRLGVTAEVDPRPQPGDIDPRLEPAVAHAALLVFPWATLVVLVAAVGIPVLVLLWHRRPALVGATACLALGALAFAAALPPGRAVAAAPAGALTFTPAKGNGASAVTLTTSARCPRGSNVLGRIYGAGFPAAGQVAVANTPISALSPAPTGGYLVPMAMSVQDLLNLQGRPVTPTGRYRLVLTCRTPFGPASLGDFTGTLTFDRSHRFTGPAAPRGTAAVPGGASPTGGAAIDPPRGPRGPAPGPGDPTALATNATRLAAHTTDGRLDLVTAGLVGAAAVAALGGGTVLWRRRRTDQEG